MQHFQLGRMPLEMLGTELVYFLIVVGICLYIFFRTRDFYSLTKHKGIFFFRNTFLFFALSFAVRAGMILFMISRYPVMMGPFRGVLWPGQFLISYLSTMAILSLAVTLFARKIKINNSWLIFMMHAVALISSVAVFLTRAQDLLLVLQTTIFLASVIFLFVKKSKGSKYFSFNRINYLLLFVFWIINIITFTRFFFIAFEIRAFLYLLSIALFIIILVRVVKRSH